MKTQPLKNLTMTVMLASLPLLFCLSSPLWAKPSRHAVKQHKQASQAYNESSKVNLPAPVADDSPINPALTKKDSGSVTKQKATGKKSTKKKRRGVKQRR